MTTLLDSLLGTARSREDDAGKRLIARRTKAEFVEYSAVMVGIKEIKQVMVDAERAKQYGTRTIVFIDENPPLQTAPSRMRSLPHVERGNIR